MNVHVFLAADHRCLWGCAVTMRSIHENVAPGSSLRFHIATNGVSEADHAALAKVAERGGTGGSARFVSFEGDQVRHLQRSRLITRTAYARLFLEELLPADVQRVIYVDCDLLFERDIRDLWTTELDDATIGAVDNRYWEDSTRHQKRLGLAEPRYFNSGVLLIDLERWRGRGIGERALKFAEDAGERLILHDQDALNGALQDDWKDLPLHWNAWTIHPDLHEDAPAVFHFMGAPKPWHADYKDRFRDKFYAYLDRTPYAGARPWNPAGLGALGRRFRRRLPFVPSAIRMLRSRFSASPK